MQYGNKDAEKKHDLSHIQGISNDRYVVRHFRMAKFSNGQEIEDPSTNRIQVYDQTTFNNLSRQTQRRQQDGSMKQFPSAFEEANLNVHVLHDPTESKAVKEPKEQKEQKAQEDDQTGTSTAKAIKVPAAKKEPKAKK